MTLSLGELASAMGLAFGVLGLIRGALMSRGNPGVTFGGGGIGAFLGFMLALRMAEDDDGVAKAVPTITKTYTYTYSYHHNVNWGLILGAPLVALIVVGGLLCALWLRLRFGPRIEQLQHHQQAPRRELTVLKSLPPATRGDHASQ